MKVYSLSPLQFSNCYGFLRGMMLDAYRNGAPHPSDLFQDILDGAVMVWLVTDKASPVAFLATRIKGDALRIVAVAGRDIRKWRGEAKAVLREHAKANGLKRITAESRKGLGRALGLRPVRAVRFEYEMEVA